MLYEKKYHKADLSQFTFLVTGGAGFIGSNIVEYLLKYDAKKVIILDNLETGYLCNIKQFLTKENCVFIEGDIRDLETCKKAMLDVDYVFHQAALGSVPRSIQNPITTNEVNIAGFLNILVVAKESDTVKKMVYASSSSTYGDHPDLPKLEENIGNPLSPYAVTKYVNELYADVFSKTYDFHSVGLRYFNVFGPNQSHNGPYAAVIPLFFYRAIKNNVAEINGDGEQTRDFTFIENVIQANIKAVFSNLDNHEVFNVAYGERISINRLWEIIKAITNSTSQVTYKPKRLGDVKDSLASIEKVKNKLNYNPEFSLYDGLEISLRWHVNNYKNLEIDKNSI